MIRQDVLITIEQRNGKPHWLFLACSAKGREAVATATGRKVSAGLVGMAITSDAKLGKRATNALYDLNGADKIDAHFVDYMPLPAIMLNAEEMAIRHEQDALDTRMADYFTPLFDAAIEARDKKRITDLFNQFPQSIAKSFIVDRLKYGKDRFEELHQPGVTIQNWHDDDQ